ncbi:MAG TPA: hypothetical protein VJS67_08515 [Pseudonocardiaceae bacterium]|nr:hypothetical protein [Pseudonocardiaceae bacterium]
MQRAIGSQGTAQVVGAKPGSRPGDLAERGVWTAADAEKQRQADHAFPTDRGDLDHYFLFVSHRYQEKTDDRGRRPR